MPLFVNKNLFCGGLQDAGPTNLIHTKRMGFAHILAKTLKHLSTKALGPSRDLERCGSDRSRFLAACDRKLSFRFSDNSLMNGDSFLWI